MTAYPPNDWRSTLVPGAAVAAPPRATPAASPIAAPASPAVGATNGSAQYQQWARGQGPGTVYGGGRADLPQPTTTLTGYMENSGSLTGHILAQGHQDMPTPKSSTAKVVVIMVIVLAVLVIAGVAAATFAGDTVTSIFDGIISGN